MIFCRELWENFQQKIRKNYQKCVLNLFSKIREKKEKLYIHHSERKRKKEEEEEEEREKKKERGRKRNHMIGEREVM